MFGIREHDGSKNSESKNIGNYFGEKLGDRLTRQEIQPQKYSPCAHCGRIVRDLKFQYGGKFYCTMRCLYDVIGWPKDRK